MMKRNFYFTDLLKKKDSDAFVYIIGLIFMPLFALCWYIASRAGLIPDFCVFRALTGIYCPGCGGTRAFLLLFRGDILQSLIYHPFIAYAVVLGVVFYTSQTVRFISRGRIKGLHMRPIYLIAGGALLLLNWAVKNLLLLIWNIKLIN